MMKRTIYICLFAALSVEATSFETVFQPLVARQIQYIDDLVKHQEDISRLLGVIVSHIPKLESDEKKSFFQGKLRRTTTTTTTTTESFDDEKKSLEDLRLELFRQANFLTGRQVKLAAAKQSFEETDLSCDFSLEKGISLITSSQLLMNFLNERAVASARLIDVVNSISDLSKRRRDLLIEAISVYASHATEEVEGQTAIRNSFGQAVREAIPLIQAAKDVTTTTTSLPVAQDEIPSDSEMVEDSKSAALNVEVQEINQPISVADEEDLEKLMESYFLISDSPFEQFMEEPVVVTMEDIEEAMRALLGPFITNDPDDSDSEFELLDETTSTEQPTESTSV